MKNDIKKRRIDVSVILVNYNTKKITEAAIKSIIEYTSNISYEIILVDNASEDGSVEYLKEIFKDKIIIIENKVNFGFGKANNQGIKLARGKYLFLINTDILLLDNSIKLMYEYMERNNQVGVCGGNLLNINLKENHSFRKRLPNIWNELKVYDFLYEKILGIKNDFNYKTEPVEVGYITGADMFIRTSVLREVGNFDEDFFMYSEETELTYRITKAGYKVISLPKVRMIHLAGASSSNNIKKFGMIMSSKYLYYYKVFGKKSLKKLYVIYSIKLVLKFIMTFDKFNLICMKVNKEEYLKMKKKYFKGEKCIL